MLASSELCGYIVKRTFGVWDGAIYIKPHYNIVEAHFTRENGDGLREPSLTAKIPHIYNYKGAHDLLSRLKQEILP